MPALTKAINNSSIESSHRAADQLLDWCDRHRWWLAGGVLLLYLAGFNGQWRVLPDSAIYLTIGQNIAQGDGFTHPDGHHASTPPGLAYLIGLAFWAGGNQGMALLHLFLLAIGLLSLGLSYMLIRCVSGRPMAMAVSCLLAINTCYYRLSYEVLTEIPFQAAMAASLLGYEWLRQGRYRIAAALLLAGSILIMTLTRSVYLVVVTAMALTVLSAAVQRYHLLKVVGLVAAGLTALLAIRLFDPNLKSFFSLTADEQLLWERLVHQLPQTLWTALTTNLWELLSESASEAAFGGDAGPFFSVPLSLIVLWAGLSTFTTRRLWGVLTAFFIAQWLLFIVTDRYFIAILLFLAFGWFHQAARIERCVGGEKGRIIFVVLTLMWFIPNTVKTGMLVVEQHRPNFLQHYDHGRFAKVDQLSAWIQSNTPDNAIIVAEHPYILPLCYLAHRRGLQPVHVPIDRLKNKPFYYVERPGFQSANANNPYGFALTEPTTTIPIDIKNHWTIWKITRASEPSQ